MGSFCLHGYRSDTNMVCDMFFLFFLSPPADINKGVGFARMESREKCEQIIQIFNGKQLPGAKDPLLVKFADGGSKKKSVFKSPDPNARTWREVTEVKLHSICVVLISLQCINVNQMLCHRIALISLLF